MFILVGEKYGNGSDHRGRESDAKGNKSDVLESESSSDSEEEDDDGVLVSKSLDAEIDATLRAIRAKDPRVYDEKVTFYTEVDGEVLDSDIDLKNKERPMYLSDYHRRNLLEGTTDPEETNKDRILSYTQQQDDLKRFIVREMNAAVEGGFNNSTDGQGRTEDVSDDDKFLVRKQAAASDSNNIIQANVKPTELNLQTANKDPETFLSNFMTARAWVPAAGSRFQPFESDDEEEDLRAERFEEAYNLRFEDPKGSNEKLLSHARDAAARYSVRRETTNSRKKIRDIERTKKDNEKLEREEEKARFRKLKISDAEEKVRKIREAAGLSSRSLHEQEWSTFLDEGWDNDRWDDEMRKRFGEDYYAGHDAGSVEREGDAKRKIHKPEWPDDIDIKDLVPDFDAENEQEKPLFTLTDDESDAMSNLSHYENNDGVTIQASNSKAIIQDSSNMRSNKNHQRSEARKDRRIIERLVDEKLRVENALSDAKSKHAGHFRYRETSPSTYGLTAHDILLATDSQLNQFAGLKKMATFRDVDKKKRDKKHLGKKARLRQWRKETFGSEDGPQRALGEVLADQGGLKQAQALDVGKTPNISDGKKPKKRSKKGKINSAQA